MADSDHCFTHVVRPYVFQNHVKNKTSENTAVIVTNGIVGLAEGIIDDTQLVIYIFTQTGKRVANGRLLETPGGALDVGFEVFPLDLDSDPAFNGVARAHNAVPLGGPSGFRSLHVPEGEFGLTPSYQVFVFEMSNSQHVKNFWIVSSYQVHSLTSTYDASNPLSKQEQATFYEADPILIKHHPVVIPKAKPVKPKVNYI